MDLGASAHYDVVCANLETPVRQLTLFAVFLLATALVCAPACDGGSGDDSAGTGDGSGVNPGDDGAGAGLGDSGLGDSGAGGGATDSDGVPGDDGAVTGDDQPFTDGDELMAPPSTLFDPAADAPAGCELGGFVAGDASLSEQQNKVSYVGRSTAREDGTYDILDVQLFQGGVGLGGATAPGTYALSGAYGSCGNCVLVRRGCSQDAAGETCERAFYADMGELEITTLGDTFAGSLRGVEAHEVTFDSAWNSVPVEGGQTWCMDDVAFSAKKPVATVVGGDLGEGRGPLQDVCVPGGTGKLIGSNIENFALTNCNGEQVWLHDECGQTQVLWMFGTAGWCGACAQTLAGLRKEWKTSQLNADAVPTGLSMWVVLSEDQYGGKPSLAYCKQYAAQHSIDPAMVVMDWADTPKVIPLVEPEGQALEVQSFGSVWEHINPYLKSVGGGVNLFVPWHAVLRGSNMEYVWSSYFRDSWALDEAYLVLIGQQ